MTIEELDLSVRSFNCLKRAGINTVEDLIKQVRGGNDEGPQPRHENLWKRLCSKLQSLGFDLHPR